MSHPYDTDPPDELRDRYRPEPTDAVHAAVDRCRPNPNEQALLVADALAASSEAMYWCELAVSLYLAIAEVNDAHVHSCVEPACRTCTALQFANAAYDAFDQAEQLRCTCSDPDKTPLSPDVGLGHFTIDCPTRPATPHPAVAGFPARGTTVDAPLFRISACLGPPAGDQAAIDTYRRARDLPPFDFDRGGDRS